MTATMWGYGPKNEELTTRRQKREEEQAGQLGEVPLDFGVTSRSTNTTKKKQIEPPETGVTHITRKNVKEMLQRKVGTARSVHNIIKISKTLKLSTHGNFESSEQRLGKPYTRWTSPTHQHVLYPDFEKNGKFVYWKLILFVMIFVLINEDEGKLNARHIGDEDVNYLLVDNINKMCINADELLKVSCSKYYAKLLREHNSFSNEQLCTLQYKMLRTAKL